MARAIAFTPSVQFQPAELVRLVLVIGSALALIAAGKMLPF